MRKPIFSLLSLLIISFLISCDSETSKPKEYIWSRYNSDVTVQQNGVLAIEETVSLRYTGGPFTFVFRDIPEQRLDGIEILEVRDAENNYQFVDDEESEKAYTYSISRNDNGELRIRWVYPPTSDTERTFTIRYLVTGAVRQFDLDQGIWWSFIPANRDVPIEQAQATLRFPEGMPAESIHVVVPDFPASIERNSSTIIAKASNIPPGEELTIQASVPLGFIERTMPAWQAAIEAQAAYNQNTRPTVNMYLSALTGGLAIVLCMAYGVWFSRTRDPKPQDFNARELPSLPDDLPPAVAGKLLGASSNQLLLATIFDLAKRGFLIFREEQAGRSSTFMLEGTKGTGELRPTEREVLDLIFEGDNKVMLKSHQNSFIEAASMLTTWAEEELIEQGIVDPVAKKRSLRATFWSIAMMILGGIGFFISMFFADSVSWWLPTIPGVLFIIGLLWMITALARRNTSQFGANQLARWKAFQRYLSQPGLPVKYSFDQLLPFATVASDPKKFTRQYASSSAALPGWFYPYSAGRAATTSSGGGQPTLLLQDFQQNFLSALKTTASSATSASSSSGGGFGGGGSSGGGGAGAG